MKTIIIYSKTHYGSVHFYVADEEQAKLISVLTGRKTITLSEIKALNKLGFEIIEKHPSVLEELGK